MDTIFLCNVSSFFSYVGTIFVTKDILAIQQILTYEEHLQ